MKQLKENEFDFLREKTFPLGASHLASPHRMEYLKPIGTL
jgi:hypothetical protein